MIESRYEISNEDGYIKYNHFEISDALQTILRDNYFVYNSEAFELSEHVENLYKQNFTDKYSREENEQMFALYIDNEKFQEKVKFIYSVIDENKYKKFAELNQEIDDPSALSIVYNVLDSENTKVQMYNINIIDIAFVF